MEYLSTMSTKPLSLKANTQPIQYGDIKVASAHGGKRLQDWQIKRGISKLYDSLSSTKARLQAKLEAKKAEERKNAAWEAGEPSAFHDAFKTCQGLSKSSM